MIERTADEERVLSFCRKNGVLSAEPGEPIALLGAKELRAALSELESFLHDFDELEPQQTDSDAYDGWADAHEALEDLQDAILDRLDELPKLHVL